MKFKIIVRDSKAPSTRLDKLEAQTVK